MLNYHKSLLVAQDVLKKLESISEDINYTIQAYQNCREQGYMVINDDHDMDKVAFIAENRNSDQIVVYIGHYSNQGLSDDAYENAKYFDTNEYLDAAIYIKENL